MSEGEDRERGRERERKREEKREGGSEGEEREIRSGGSIRRKLSCPYAA